MRQLPWVTKHRPKLLKHIIGQEHVITSLQNLLVNINEFPHVLFHGPAGVGKTTTAKALAREIFGEHWKEIVLVINASNERQVDVVRSKISGYCRTSASIHDVPRKMIILEEFDGFGKHGQHALREPMEEYADNVIMVITCNFPKKIIKPLRSRCAVMKFTPASEENIIKYTARVARTENIEIDGETLSLIASNAFGDFRPAINVLQMAVQRDDGRLYVTKERVLEVANLLTEESAEEIANLIIEGDIAESIKMMDSFITSGISPEIIITILYKYFDKKGRFDMTTKNGIEALKIFSDTSESVSTSTISSITMSYFVARLYWLYRGKK